MDNASYQLTITGAVLELTTASFRAEKGSVLHSGIYNRELASSLAAGAGTLLAGFFFTRTTDMTPLHYGAALLLFVALFLLFRSFVFRDPFLRTTIDKAAGAVTFLSPKPFGYRRVSFPLAELAGVRQDYRTETPENPDGVKLVERISLQHGAVIPGFGETAHFYTVELEFTSGPRSLVYSSGDAAAAEEIASKIKLFIER